MKTLIYGFAISLGMFASDAKAEQMVNVDGELYALSSLMENCQSITDPAAQITCFAAISQLMEEQSAQAQESDVSVTEALAAFRAVAEYQDEDSGLSIVGSFCSIHVLYYGNYFHISRRNISSLDLFSAQFNASKLQFDQVSEVRGGQAPLVRGVMEAGANAATRGGIGLESAQYNFEPRPPSATMDVYANDVVNQLPAVEGGTFEFVLVHPQRSQASTEIWAAFEAFVDTCRS